MSPEPFVAFLGEREEPFALNGALIMDLERLTGVGIMSLFKRLIDRTFLFADIVHTIRLGLIGGGMAPETAARVCATYVEGRPVMEAWPIALGTLDYVLFGKPAPKGDSDASA